MYKSFGVTLAATQFRRTMTEKGGMSRAAYAANAFIGAAMFGALSVQLRDIGKGKTPRPMDTPEFWGAAVLQGGGLGIYGDFLSAATDRHGSSLQETIAGPVVGLGSDIGKMTIGNVAAVVQGEDTHVGRDAVRFAQRYTPGGSLWYGRLAFNRIILDQLQKEVDPDYQSQFHQMERRARDEMGQDFWWRPGEVAPETAE